jgi:hypothetical protein
MKKSIPGYSPVLCAAVLVSCGGGSVTSEAETIDVGLSVQPGTVAQNLVGEDGLSLVDQSKIKFKYVIKGCKSGFRKDGTQAWATAGESIKLYKNDTGCIAELSAIQFNSADFDKIFSKTSPSSNPITVTLDGTKLAAGTSASIGYYYYKSSTLTEFVLKVPDHEVFDTSKAASVKWAFESLRSDLISKNVSGVANSQGLSVGALESPNFTMGTAADDIKFVGPDSKSAAGKTYYGFTVDARFTCEDPTAANLKKINGTGASAACRTAGGDNQSLSKMRAVLVAGRTNDDALTYDDAEAKFSAAVAVETSLGQTAVTGSVTNTTMAGFSGLRWWQTEALPGGTLKGWLIIQMSDADTSGNKFASYSVFNVNVAQ